VRPARRVVLARALTMQACPLRELPASIPTLNLDQEE
jgi:hypothetical protein